MATKLASIQLDFRYWDFPELKNIRYAGIPWDEHLKIYSGYCDKTGQTAERISERGGFGVKEAIKYYGWETPVIWVSSQKEYPSSDDDWEKYELAYDTESDTVSIKTPTTD